MKLTSRNYQETGHANHEEVIQEASFWQERIQQWKCRLSSVHENGSKDDETLTNDVERILSAVQPIKECQSHIQLLATDSLRTRQEVANRDLVLAPTTRKVERDAFNVVTCKYVLVLASKNHVRAATWCRLGSWYLALTVEFSVCHTD